MQQLGFSNWMKHNLHATTVGICPYTQWVTLQPVIFTAFSTELTDVNILLIQSERTKFFITSLLSAPFRESIAVE